MLEKTFPLGCLALVLLVVPRGATGQADQTKRAKCLVAGSRTDTVTVSLSKAANPSGKTVQWFVDDVPFATSEQVLKLDFDPWDHDSYIISARDKQAATLCEAEVVGPARLPDPTNFSEETRPNTSGRISNGTLNATLSADKARIGPGDSVELKWETHDAQNVSIDGVGPIPNTGELKLSIQEPKKIHLRATDKEGNNVDASVNVGVEYPAAPPPPPEPGKTQPKIFVEPEMQVYFATERAPVPDEKVRFGPTFASDMKIRYGVAQVIVQSRHKRFFKTDPLFWSYGSSDFQIAASPSLTESAFFSEIALLASRDPTKKQMLLFIHGFNNTFIEDIFKTAQLAYDTGFKGPAVMFDWPSTTGINPLDPFRGYIADRTSAQNSVDQLSIFLKALAQNSPDAQINIVAHSMGNRLLLESLESLRKQNELPSLGCVILAAPDVGEIEFTRILPKLVETHKVQSFTLYGSRSDWALRVSRHENQQHIVGQLPPATPVVGIDEIDASELPMNLIGHDYFMTTSAVLADIAQVLSGAAAKMPRSQNLRPVVSNAYSYWQFAPQ